MMKNNKKRKLNEDALRSLLRREITKILEAEETEKDNQEDSEEQEEQGLPADLEAATNIYVRKLKETSDGLEDSDLVEMISTIITAFADSSEHRLNILKGIRSNIIR